MKPINNLLNSACRLTHPALGTILVRFAIIGLSLIAGVLTARLLGPDGRGQYFQVIAIAGLVAQFSNFGLTSSNIFYVAQDCERSWPMLVNSILLSCFVLIFTAVSIFCFGTILEAFFGMPAYLLWFIPVICAGSLLLSLVSSVMAGNEKFFIMNLWQFGNSIIVVLGMLTIGWIISTPAIFLLVVSFAACISAITGIFVLKPKYSPFQPDFVLFKMGIKYSFRAYFAIFIGFLLPRIGILIIGGSHGTHELGQYSIAVQIFDVIAVLPGSVALVLLPRLVKSSSDKWSVTKVSLWVTMGGILLISIILVVFGKSLIEAIFGEEFSPSYSVVICLLPGIIAYAAISILSQYIVSSDFPLKLVAIWSFGFLITLLTALNLVPKLGADGAAMAQSVGLLFILVGVSYFVYLKHRNNYL